MWSFRSSTVLIAIFLSFLLTSSICYAEEFYVEGEGSSGYVDVDDGYAEGFLEDKDGNEFFVGGDCQDGVVYDGLKFYEGIPEDDEDAFGQKPALLDEDFFGQELDYYNE